LASPSGFPNWKIPLSRNLMPLGDKWKLLLLENTDLWRKKWSAQANELRIVSAIMRSS
jgi:hypothetical protein